MLCIAQSCLVPCMLLLCSAVHSQASLLPQPLLWLSNSLALFSYKETPPCVETA